METTVQAGWDRDVMCNIEWVCVPEELMVSEQALSQF